MVRHVLLALFCFICVVSSVDADVLYTEEFTGDEGTISLAGWTGVYNSGNGGIYGDFAWVYHNGDCENLIYTSEYSVDTSSYTEIVFTHQLRKYDSYDQTPESSLVVQVGGSWYVAKDVSVSSSDTFETVTVTYDPAADQWDELNISTAERGSTAAVDLSGAITGFGLYSNSQNEGGSCTAEYDAFTITATPVSVEPPSTDIDDSGVVDLADYSVFSSAWQTTQGQANFKGTCDFNPDNTINIDDWYVFAQDWLLGAKYPYTQKESVREKVSFNVGWKFYRGAVSGDASSVVSYDDSSWDAVNIPHNPPMNLSEPDPLRPGWPDYSYEGVSWYRKHFTVGSDKQGKKLFIEFEAANTVSDVWVNGTHLTTHYGGYLPFTVDVTDVVSYGGTDNVIAVKVDNTDNTDVPIGNEGWFNWGGIYRDVWLHVTDPLHVTDAVYADMIAGGGIFVTYPSVTTDESQVQVKTHILNEDAAAVDCTVKTFVVDAAGDVVAEASSTQSLSGGADTTFTQTATVMNPSLWHPNSPYLYTLYTEVYDGQTLSDIYQTPIGIRSISFSKAEGFKINGQAFKFRGTNRLQDYPYIGYAAGNLAQRRDAEKLKAAGFDFIRMSHYPQDPAFMDACDELGILVLDAIPGFQYVGGTTFQNHSYQDMRDMIRRDRNHPCVIGWELSLNETNFDSTYAQTAVSYGHAEYPGNQCYVAGWKYDTTYDIYIATPSAGAYTYSGNRPLIVSEYGHWEFGGDAGGSDVHRDADVSTKYDGGEAAMIAQVQNHREGHNINLGQSNMCGDGLWVGIDYGPYPSGVLDPFRLPKFSYYFWQSQRDADIAAAGLESGPMVFVANCWTSSSPSDVTVYSNCEQIRLYVNDTLQATRSPDSDSISGNLLHPPFTFSGVSYQTGRIKAEGLIDGQVAAVYTVDTPGSGQSLAVAFDVSDDVPANGSETIFVYASILDAEGTVLPDDSRAVTFNVTGEGFLQSPVTVDAEAGIAAAIIRVTDQPGLIMVTATASGLSSSNTSMTTE